MVAVTGASGSVYAERLIATLVATVPRIYLLVTEAGQQVARHELRKQSDGGSLLRWLDGEFTEHEKTVFRLCKNDDLFSPAASGSSCPTDMVVVPCSMGTLARVSSGVSSNLLERAADVMLKQRRKLIMVPRETPLSSIHLRNMLTLSDMGVHMIPAMPAFYQKPQTIDDMVDFVVGRIIESLDLPHGLYQPWNSRMM